MWRHTFEWLLIGTVLIGCTGKDGDTSVDDTDTGPAPEVDEVYSASILYSCSAIGRGLWSGTNSQ